MDSIGPDELRILWKEVQLSKEFLRQFYRDSDWYRKVQQAKEIAREEGVADWKQICVERLQARPEPLPDEVKETVSTLYPSLVNECARQFGYGQAFADSPPIRVVAKNLRRLLAAGEESE